MRITFPLTSRTILEPKSFGFDGYPQVIHLKINQSTALIRITYASHFKISKITLASKNSVDAIWNHAFCFSSDEEKNAMFSERGFAALVIEFYPYKKSNHK
jgi:hypothetical protein